MGALGGGDQSRERKDGIDADRAEWATQEKSTAVLTWWGLKDGGRRTLSIRWWIDSAQALRKWRRDGEGGMVQCDQAQGFDRPTSHHHLSFHSFNFTPSITRSLYLHHPRYHPLISSIQILISSLHHSVINRHREVKVKQADTGGWVEL